MNKRVVVLLVICLAFISLQGVALFAQDAQGDHGKPEPPMAGVHWAKGQQPGKGGGGSSPNLNWYGGSIMQSVTVRPIFWGPSWGSLSFAGDKVTGLTTFYTDMSGSTYANTTNEFYDSSNHVGSTISVGTSVVDLSPATGGSQTSPILNEVCKSISSPVANGYYPVYTDVRRGSAGYCAWHSAGSCGATPVQFAFFFNLDGDIGCDPQDSLSGHSQGLAALANVSGHELSEARTDPRLNAWMDRQGSENSDKCAWSFGSPLLTFSDGNKWKVQGNWSNYAYSHSTGYPNLNGQKGCIDSSN